MCKVLKDYGVVADHGSKVLKLQKIMDGEKKLALVSYKDGMSVGYKEYTREDANKIKAYLEDYLDYKPVSEPEVSETANGTANENIIKSLTTLPSGDCNYQTLLRIATKEDLEQAIAIMEKGGRHATRIKACQNALKKAKNTKTTTVKADNKTKAEPKKEEPKVVKFPTEDNKPKIIPLKTEGNRTYGECVVKLKKEAEMFKDSDSQYVIEGLLELAKVDGDFRNNLMRDDKSYGDFMEYMFKAAQNGYCVKYGNVGWLDRDLGLGLAIDYYNADTEQMKAEEDAKRKAEAEKRKAEIEANKAKKGAKNGTSNKGKKRKIS